MSIEVNGEGKVKGKKGKNKKDSYFCEVAQKFGVRTILSPM